MTYGVECYQDVLIVYDTDRSKYCFHDTAGGMNGYTCSTSLSEIKDVIDLYIFLGYNLDQCPCRSQRFRVLNSLGSPLSGAAISVKICDFFRFSCITDGDGYCTITHLKSSREFTAIASKTGFVFSPVNFAPSGTDVIITSTEPSISSIQLSIPPLSASASLPPSIALSEITLETIPSLSASVSLLTFSLPPISLEALPSLLATVSLPPEISVPFDSIPSLSATVSFGVVITLPAFVFDFVPSLSPFIHLPLAESASSLASAIIAQNQKNLAGAFIERTADFKIAGWTTPPFVCFLCSETLYTEEDFITHMTKHLTAYEEGGE